jgi:hypothetical protein
VGEFLIPFLKYAVASAIVSLLYRNLSERKLSFDQKLSVIYTAN